MFYCLPFISVKRFNLMNFKQDCCKPIMKTTFADSIKDVGEERTSLIKTRDTSFGSQLSSQSLPPEASPLSFPYQQC